MLQRLPRNDRSVESYHPATADSIVSYIVVVAWQRVLCSNKNLITNDKYLMIELRENEIEAIKNEHFLSMCQYRSRSRLYISFRQGWSRLAAT